jgi:excisionase family DNA binding protein
MMTLAEAAELLRISYARAAELARQNVLPHFKLGRQVRVSSAQLADFIARGGQALAGGWRREAR